METTIAGAVVVIIIALIAAISTKRQKDKEQN